MEREKIRKIVQKLQETKHHGQVVNIAFLVSLCELFSIRGHLAILNQPYVDRILEGLKTIESRFAKNKQPPYKSAQKGDLVFLKVSSGPIKGVVEVVGASYYGPLIDQEALEIMQKYSGQLCLDAKFVEMKKESKYASLIGLGDVQAILDIVMEKKDRRAWVDLNGYQRDLL